jgi:hypothetical protein
MVEDRHFWQFRTRIGPIASKLAELFQFSFQQPIFEKIGYFSQTSITWSIFNLFSSGFLQTS